MKEDPYKKSARKYDIFVEPFNLALGQIGMGMYPSVAGMNVLDKLTLAIKYAFQFFSLFFEFEKSSIILKAISSH